ncbi:MAG: hypothetical protein NC337_06520 [Roseburia sp.]|nr:hypothetical protein [Roseburia sp.]
MSECRYNIPKQYKVDKGMPLEPLLGKLENAKCRRIIESSVESVKWCYHIVDKKGIVNVAELVRESGLSVLEVSLRRQVCPELLTEVFAGLFQRPIILAYLCGEEFSLGTFLPSENTMAGRMCSTDFYPRDTERMIEIMDYERDQDKTVAQMHERFLATLRRQKRAIMIEKAYEQINDKVEDEILAFEFSLENLDKIREDSEFVQAQLRVV